MIILVIFIIFVQTRRLTVVTSSESLKSEWLTLLCRGRRCRFLYNIFFLHLIKSFIRHLSQFTFNKPLLFPLISFVWYKKLKNKKIPSQSESKREWKKMKKHFNYLFYIEKFIFWMQWSFIWTIIFYIEINSNSRSEAFYFLKQILKLFFISFQFCFVFCLIFDCSISQHEPNVWNFG
jgi:hypothetical protein